MKYLLVMMLATINCFANGDSISDSLLCSGSISQEKFTVNCRDSNTNKTIVIGKVSWKDNKPIIILNPKLTNKEKDAVLREVINYLVGYRGIIK